MMLADFLIRNESQRLQSYAIVRRNTGEFDASTKKRANNCALFLIACENRTGFRPLRCLAGS